MRRFATSVAWMLAGGMLCATGRACAATAERAPWGTLADGTAIEAVTLTGKNGVSARIVSFGAMLQAFEAPDRNGRIADITLGYDGLQSYVDHPYHWGQTIGRYANRVAGGTFALDGKTYTIIKNDTANGRAFEARAWQIVSVRQGAVASVRMVRTSPAGEQGYPGTLQASVTYSLDDHGALTIDFDATSDMPTIVNMTNHAVFDLAGEGTRMGALGHRLTVFATRFTPVDDRLIPTGELKPVAGGAFDFTHARALTDGVRDGRDRQIVIGRGYDHNFVLDKGVTAAPALAARLEDASSGRVLEVLTTEPGLQVYSANFLGGTLVGKKGHLYRMGDGIALEPEKFPDTPNQPAFGSARVEPGRPYHHRMIYRVSVAR